MSRIFLIIFIGLLSSVDTNCNPTKEVKDTVEFDCDRYFYYLDLVKDYQSGYSVPKELLYISIEYIEKTTSTKSIIIIDDYSSSFENDEYEKQMKSWIDWYVNTVCNITKEEHEKLYARYFPIIKKDRYNCPCNKD